MSFFVCQAEAARDARDRDAPDRDAVDRDAVDRDAVDRDAVTIRQFQHQIIQGQIRFCHYPRLDPAPRASQLAVAAAVALRARLQHTHFTLQDHHVVDEFYRNPNPCSCRTV